MFIRGKHRKNQKDDCLCILKMRVQELFMHWEGISTSRAHHKGQHPSTKCAKHDFKMIYFPFLCFLSFGVDSSRAIALRILNCDEELRPM